MMTWQLRLLTNDPGRVNAQLSGRGRAAGPHLTVPAEAVVLVHPPAARTAVFQSDGTSAMSDPRARRAYCRFSAYLGRTP